MKVRGVVLFTGLLALVVGCVDSDTEPASDVEISEPSSEVDPESEVQPEAPSSGEAIAKSEMALDKKLFELKRMAYSPEEIGKLLQNEKPIIEKELPHNQVNGGLANTAG